MKIELRDLSFAPQGKVVFSQLNYTFTSNGNYLIQGSSGCGKSSLLTFISSLRQASSGQIIIDGQEPVNFCEHRKNCQWLRQTPYIYDKTVRENLSLSLAYHQLAIPSDDELKKHLQYLFPEGLDLEERAMELSGGQKHRLALLRSYLLKPKALLCDEISAGLDEKSRQLSEDFIFNYCSEMTVIFVSHIQESFESRESFTRLLMSKEGFEPL
ncbi:ATPase [Lentisphaera araneosa HTCC2155]|uniref:ATPase n=1 Tax=Lentisphaera araneosa HTCC2155 TaxID=313628 RepID=A6DS87_9BACT|nr:ATP-binding cassette domain-containing protein [Lentisphaera araneosa]EDM25547.1 ATPase [Lentisphaera araneosa HTCC2155]